MSDDLIAEARPPISVRGLKKMTKQVQTEWGGNVRVEVSQGAIQFLRGGVPNKGRNPHV